MRIGDFEKAASGRQAGGDAPPRPDAASPARFWDLPDADFEAGQDKLRSAVEWGIYQRFSGISGSGTLLNLKPSCGATFFRTGGRTPDITMYPGGSDPLGWAAGLPPGSFDAVYGLDSCGRCGDPLEAIDVLGRLLKKEGTLFLNFFSRDHFALADSLPSLPGRAPAADRAALPSGSVTAGEIREWAERNGLGVGNVIPYSSFYGNSLWLELMESRFRWERILDWLSSDAKLFEFALFLEERIAAHLAPACAPRFAVVLRKPASAPPQTRGGLAPAEELRAASAVHLGDIRNRVFLHHLWRLAQGHLKPSVCAGWEEWLPVAIREEYSAWMAQEGLDAKGMGVVDGWHRIPEVGRTLRHRGIPLGPGLQYEQLRGMLSGVFGCFRKAGPE